METVELETRAGLRGMISGRVEKVGDTGYYRLICYNENGVRSDTLHKSFAAAAAYFDGLQDRLEEALSRMN